MTRRPRLKVRDLQVADLKPGMFAAYDTVLGKRETAAFAGLTGDVSPLHVDAAYARRTPHKTNLAHGMLSAGHFSTIVGVLLPGRPALLSRMELDFLEPVPVGSAVTISGKVAQVSPMASAITLDLLVLRGALVCVTGKATVTVRPRTR